jgi:hypothetical protein
VAAIGCGFAGAAHALRRPLRGEETPLDVIVIAGVIAIGVTFAIHVDFSYGRHLYPRYYLPLAAIMPLAGLSLYGAIKEPRWRNVLLAFLIAGRSSSALSARRSAERILLFLIIRRKPPRAICAGARTSIARV